MSGVIEIFRPDTGAGINAAGDGRTYRFQRGNILNASFDLQGEAVHFELQASTRDDIIVLSGSPWSAFPNPKHF